MKNKRVLVDEVVVKGKTFPVFFVLEDEDSLSKTGYFQVEVDGRLIESAYYDDLASEIERRIPDEIIGWVPLIKVRFVNGILSTFEKVQAAKVEHTSFSILYDWAKWNKLARVDLNQVPFSYTVTIDGITTFDFTVPYTDELWMEIESTQAKMKLLGDELKQHIFANETISEFGV